MFFLERDVDGINVFVHRVVADVREDIDCSGDSANPKVSSMGSEITKDEQECETKGESFVFSDGTEFVLPPGLTLKHLERNDAAQAAELIKKYSDVFSAGPHELGFCDVIPHQIRLDDDTPVNLPYRRVLPSLVTEV